MSNKLIRQATKPKKTGGTQSNTRNDVDWAPHDSDHSDGVVSMSDGMESDFEVLNLSDGEPAKKNKGYVKVRDRKDKEGKDTGKGKGKSVEEKKKKKKGSGSGHKK